MKIRWISNSERSMSEWWRVTLVTMVSSHHGNLSFVPCLVIEILATRARLVKKAMRNAKLPGCQWIVERYKMNSTQWTFRPTRSGKKPSRSIQKSVWLLFTACCLKCNIKLEWNIHSVNNAFRHSIRKNCGTISCIENLLSRKRAKCLQLQLLFKCF